MAFELPKLPYAYDALEPHIDARTMEIHHTKHHNGYTTKLNGAIEGTPLEGKSIEEAITEVRKKDNEANYRQVAGMDNKGNVFAFTGKSLKYWNGEASEIIGKNYVVIGNQLNKNVLLEMSKTFENTDGTLAEKLMKSLISGQNSGGQISGKQSAALAVKGIDNAWYNQIDLRVDNSKEPIKDLEILLDYHNGRIRLNQSIFALREGNFERAKEKLSESEVMLDGWTGMYSKIAATNIALENENQAINWIEKGLAENSNWSVNLPAFYFLKDNPKIKSIIKPNTFTIKDWETSLGMLSNMGQELEVISLAKSLIDKNLESSYLYFLLGRSYHYEKEPNEAIKFLKKAIQLDKENVEAESLLTLILK